MPRRVLPPAVTAPVPPPPPSPLVQRLRQDWRWAGISQFIWTFSDAFGLLDWDIEELERDLDGIEDALLPELIAKLLYALTWNRQINRENAFENLRKQYIKREPENTILGTLEEPVEWATLGLSQKVGILWQLCEWQLVDPARFRSLLKSEDEATSWRIDPVGWDKQGNTYYLFDDNRLWIQRARPVPPRAPKKTSLKAKRAQKALKKSRPPPKRSHKKKPVPKERLPTPPPKVEEPVTGRRQRKQVVIYGNVTPTVEALKRGGAPPAETPTKSSRSTRSSGRLNVESPVSASKPAPLPRGTRVSRRLHAVDDEWQQVPEGWLEPAGANGRDADDESELSALTDEEEHEAQVKAAMEGSKSPSPKKEESPLSDAPEEVAVDGEADDVKDEGDDEAKEEEPEEPSEDEQADAEDVDDVKLALAEAAELPADFVEWEAVCVTLYDWQSYPEQWAKSKDPDEKALYKLLVDDVAPQVIEVLIAKEQERIKQEAINNRKRSSRIATRELEREEKLRIEAAQREMEERMEKSRLEQARIEAEQAELLAREQAREARVREREHRLAAREQALQEEQREREKAERRREKRKRRRDGEQVDWSSGDEGITPARVHTPARSAAPSDSQSWELKCEVCKEHGWNLADDADVVCCDDCGRWQHVKCHDRRDIASGRGLRDWDKVDFQCEECRERSAKRQRVDDAGKATHVNGASPLSIPQATVPRPPIPAGAAVVRPPVLAVPAAMGGRPPMADGHHAAPPQGYVRPPLPQLQRPPTAQVNGHSPQPPVGQLPPIQRLPQPQHDPRQPLHAGSDPRQPRPSHDPRQQHPTQDPRQQHPSHDPRQQHPSHDPRQPPPSQDPRQQHYGPDPRQQHHASHGVPANSQQRPPPGYPQQQPPPHPQQQPPPHPQSYPQHGQQSPYRPPYSPSPTGHPGQLPSEAYRGAANGPPTGYSHLPRPSPPQGAQVAFRPPQQQSPQTQQHQLAPQHETPRYAPSPQSQPHPSPNPHPHQHAPNPQFAQPVAPAPAPAPGQQQHARPPPAPAPQQAPRPQASQPQPQPHGASPPPPPPVSRGP